MPFLRACQNTLAKQPKMFRSYWMSLEQNAKILQSMSRNEKKRKNFPAKNHQKTFWTREKQLRNHRCKSFLLKSVKYFSENWKKLLIVFQFLFFSKLILWTQGMHLWQFYPRLIEVGLGIHAWFFSTKKRKNVAQGLNIFKKFRIFSKKILFVKYVQ